MVCQESSSAATIAWVPHSPTDEAGLRERGGSFLPPERPNSASFSRVGHVEYEAVDRHQPAASQPGAAAAQMGAGDGDALEQNA